MEQEENVYKETTRAEEAMRAKHGETEKSFIENASTVPSKFKDVNALAQAYDSLQAEFTRRSQRLRELERERENLQKEGRGEKRSGVEKLRKNAEMRRAEEEKFDEFVKTFEKEAFRREEDSAGKPESVEAFAVTTDADGSSGEGESEKEGAVREKIGSNEKTLTGNGGATLSSDALYEQVCRDETVRLKIVGEYLASIGKSGAPLTMGGAGTLAAPPVKAKSIGDAGKMALRYFKKGEN